MKESKSKSRFSRSNPLRLERVRKGLSDTLFSKDIVYYETIGSTNTEAKRLADEKASEGVIVIAEEQTAGRGRLGRRWISPKYHNLLFSLLLRPTLEVDQVFVLTMILAIAAIEGIEGECRLSPGIKWPNDLYVGRKKLSGILTEFSTEGKNVEYVILGMGLNVNWSPETEKELLYPSTSIMGEIGRDVSRERLLIAILRRLDRYYGDSQMGKIDSLYQKWNERSLVLGKQVEIVTAAERTQGKAVSIDQKGALVIVDDSGQEQTILCGDVSLRY